MLSIKMYLAADIDDIILKIKEQKLLREMEVSGSKEFWDQ